MKRILSLILCLLMLVSAAPAMAVSADEPAAKNFDDVKSGKWYYEGVMWCAERGYMTGESETLFAPSQEMTRSMLVTVLAAIAGVDTNADEYQNSSFVDVKAGKWYTGAVVWANANNIANGISDDTFGYKNPVTREQLVVMVYGFMKYMNIDVTSVRETAFERFGDKNDVHSWAIEAMKWAVTNEIISGTGTIDGAPQLSPRTTATRAQIAVIVKAMLEKNLGGEYPVGSLTLGGSDISEFAIVYGTTYRGYDSGKEVAEQFKHIISAGVGVELPVYADTQLPAVEGAKEILIGKTNREEAGLVTVDRKDLVGDALLYEMKGNYLVIASNEECAGTYLACTRFCEDNLGYTYYGSDIGFEGFTSVKSAEIADGCRVTDKPYMDFITNYQYGGWDKFVSPSETYLNFGNMVHSIPLLACPGCKDYNGLEHAHHLEHYMNTDPCLSDSDNIERIINNVKTLLKEHPNDELFWVSQSDGSDYCKCNNCLDIYRVWGRCATYIQLLNFVGEAIKEEAPGVKVVGLAYKYTMIAPKTADEVDQKKYDDFAASYEGRYLPPLDITSPENVALCIATDNSCYSHAIEDPECKNAGYLNSRYDKNFKQYTRIVSTVFIWDYLHADAYSHTPFPNIHKIWQNYNYFYRNGVTGTFTQGGTSLHADFSELRSYLVARLNYAPDMTFEEYSEYANEFLADYYGDGWTYIREYIDTLEELSNENEFHNWLTSWWNNILREEQWDENYDYLRNLWETALELADSDEQKFRVKRTMTQILYVELQMAYHDYQESGDPADLDYFRELNNAYAAHMREVGFRLPNNWAESMDPDNWLH